MLSSAAIPQVPLAEACPRITERGTSSIVLVNLRESVHLGVIPHWRVTKDRSYVAPWCEIRTQQELRVLPLATGTSIIKVVGGRTASSPYI